MYRMTTLGGSQNLERRNVERPKIKKNELFDNFIFKLFFSFSRNHLNTQNI